VREALQTAGTHEDPKGATDVAREHDEYLHDAYWSRSNGSRASCTGVQSSGLFRTDKRRVSLVDVVSFTVMDAEGLTDVLGLDPDFTAEGFRLLP
jgi:predicted nucleic acid-binding protein